MSHRGLTAGHAGPGGFAGERGEEGRPGATPGRTLFYQDYGAVAGRYKYGQYDGSIVKSSGERSKVIFSMFDLDFYSIFGGGIRITARIGYSITYEGTESSGILNIDKSFYDLSQEDLVLYQGDFGIYRLGQPTIVFRQSTNQTIPRSDTSRYWTFDFGIIDFRPYSKETGLNIRQVDSVADIRPTTGGTGRLVSGGGVASAFVELIDSIRSAGKITQAQAESLKTIFTRN